MEPQSSRWQIGFLLALSTTLLWGTLPIALKMLLSHIDAITLTWYRFVAAVVLVGAYLIHRQALPKWHMLRGKTGLFLGIAILGLVGNYVVFLLGLDHISPEASQVLIQLGPMFFLLGSVFVFKEKFRPVQWLGFVILFFGLGLFFHHRIEEIIYQWSGYTLGLFWIVVAAAIWAIYALAQKQLMREMAPAQILLLIYVAGVFLLLPASNPTVVAQLSIGQWGLLAFSAINTVLAYSCFAKSQQYMESSRVSAVIALTPLFTLLFSSILVGIVPGYSHSERLDWLSLLGAALVVIGSLRTVLVRDVEVELPGEAPAESFGTQEQAV